MTTHTKNAVDRLKPLSETKKFQLKTIFASRISQRLIGGV